MADENTEKTGAEPDNTGKVADVADSTPAKDAKSDSSPENVPWNKDPRFQEFNKQRKELTASHEKLQKLLKANNLEDADDLVELVESGSKVKGKVRDINDLEQIIKDAEEIRSYRPYWQAQKENAERERRANQDPEERERERAIRAEQELHVLKNDKARREFERKQADATKAAISGYDNEVKSLIKEMDMPKDQTGFILEFMGVGNPANDIDITDKKAIKRLVADAAKKKDDYDQAVIKAYLAGKGQTPKVGSAGTGAPELNKPKLMLRDGSSKRAFLERMRSAGG
jgi:hypothetical protein